MPLPLNLKKIPVNLSIYLYCITPSHRLRAGARQCGVSGRNAFKNKKVPIRYVSWCGIKDDRVKILKVRNRLTVMSDRLKGLKAVH